MTDQPVTSPNTGTPASQAANVPGAGVPLSASQLADLLKSDPALQEAVADIANRKSQSNRDKRINKLEESLARLTALEQSGFQRPAALRMLELEDQVNELTASRVTQSVPAGNQGHAAPSVDYSLHLSALDLDANDPEVVSTVRAGGDVAANLARLKVQRKAAPANSPNPATVLPTGAGQPQSSPDLQTAYQNEIAALRGTGNIQAFAQIKAKYRKAGLNI